MGFEPTTPTLAGCARRRDQGSAQASVRRCRDGSVRIAFRLGRSSPGNAQCPLLPKLLPNAVARSGTETNEEPSNTEKSADE